MRERDAPSHGPTLAPASNKLQPEKDIKDKDGAMSLAVAILFLPGYQLLGFCFGSAPTLRTRIYFSAFAFQIKLLRNGSRSTIWEANYWQRILRRRPFPGDGVLHIRLCSCTRPGSESIGK